MQKLKQLKKLGTDVESDVVDTFSVTIKPLFETLGIGKEPSSFPNFEDLARLHPDRPDPDALICEMEIFTIHCESTNSNVQDISGAAKVAEKMKSVFPLINKAFRLVLTAPVTVA